MMRERLSWLLGLLVLAAGAWWVSANTEWVDVKRARPDRGEARANPVHAAERLLRGLGMHTEHHEQLDRLPPDGARLVLLSGNWHLVPERAEGLRQWVERGGHLVLLEGTDWHKTPLAAWVPVSTVQVREYGQRRHRVVAAQDKALARARAEAASAAASTPADLRKLEQADDAKEEEDGRDDAGQAAAAALEYVSTPPLLGSVPRLSRCAVGRHGERLRQPAGAPEQWRVSDHLGALALRLPAGRGSVTVLKVGPFAVYNAMALECDRPLLLAEAVQARSGATVWFFLGERREPLLAWLWQQGWIAVLFAALALAGGLWRGAVRFGPRLAPPPLLRRSIAEQVRGMGAYLHRHGRDALLAAQQRALHEAAARVLHRYAALPLAERISAVAQATGLPRDGLDTALSARDCTPAELPHRLHLLETARRRLTRPHDERPPR